MSLFSMGLDTHRIPMAMYKENREKLVKSLKDAGFTSGVVVLNGGEQQHRYDTDTEIVFRQESFFNYLFGVTEPEFSGVIHVDDGKTVLFCPKLHELYAVWQGEIKKPEFFKTKYEVEDVLYSENLGEYVTRHASKASPVFLLEGRNSDSGSHSVPAKFDGLSTLDSEGAVNHTALHPILAECRVTKSEKELEVLGYVSGVSSRAHVEVMQAIRPGMAEYQLESLFLHSTYTHGGCRHTAYTCICACGPNGAVLHYGHAAAPNNRILNDGDMALLDMGAEYACYCSDITCSYPVNGKFTDNQRAIYQAVLDAQRAVMERARAGVSWPDMHRVATRTCVEGLIKAGVLQGGSVDDVVAAGLGPIFMPHGLGHLLGCDVHDVGGYLPGHPERVMEDGPSYGICKLRTARVLKAGMVLTVEPGIYFMRALLDKALSTPSMAKYINKERLSEFDNFGGIRLEDVVAVTEEGCYSLASVPRTIEEVEHVMQYGATALWPPKVDGAPWLKREWGHYKRSP